MQLDLALQYCEMPADLLFESEQEDLIWLNDSLAGPSTFIRHTSAMLEEKFSFLIVKLSIEDWIEKLQHVIDIYICSIRIIAVFPLSAWASAHYFTQEINEWLLFQEDAICHYNGKKANEKVLQSMSDTNCRDSSAVDISPCWGLSTNRNLAIPLFLNRDSMNSRPEWKKIDNRYDQHELSIYRASRSKALVECWSVHWIEHCSPDWSDRVRSMQIALVCQPAGPLVW